MRTGKQKLHQISPWGYETQHNNSYYLLQYGQRSGLFTKKTHDDQSPTKKSLSQGRKHRKSKSYTQKETITDHANYDIMSPLKQAKITISLGSEYLKRKKSSYIIQPRKQKLEYSLDYPSYSFSIKRRPHLKFENGERTQTSEIFKNINDIHPSRKNLFLPKINIANFRRT